MENIAEMARKLAKKNADEAREKAEREKRESEAADARLKYMDEQIVAAFKEVAAGIKGFAAEGNTLIYRGQRVAEAKVAGRMVEEEWTESLNPPKEWAAVYELWTPGCNEPRDGYGSRPLETPYYRHLESFRSALANHVARYVGGK